MIYDIIIGLEIHAELKTKSKMFCSCKNGDTSLLPNTAVCPICLGHPGTLPKVNNGAIDMLLKLGLALNGKINKISKFDRKNYFYPDLPKGYQISQYDLPLIASANLLGTDITRIHLEEDTGKLTHPNNSTETLVDYNRAGVPLIELVTEPVIKDASSAKKFCQKYQELLRYLDISSADMEKGQMRCEANISLQTKGTWKYEDGKILPKNNETLNNKVEIKNINSFRSLEKAINFEIQRQTELLEKNTKIKGETRGWSDTQNKTFSQREKESSADYRYFPEPDIPYLEITEEILTDIKNSLPELPEQKIIRFINEYELNPETTEILIGDQILADWYETVMSELFLLVKDRKDETTRQNKKLSDTTANWIINEIPKYYSLNNFTKLIEDKKITAQTMAELIDLLLQNKINSTAGQKILGIMAQTGKCPTDIMSEEKLEQTTDTDFIGEAIQFAFNAFPAQKLEYQAGKDSLLQFFVGQVMAKTKGRANPETVIEEIKKMISKE
jgi:aspartyl-tRNA(Asn)/glutamyl-tRNA(Gln) amidotransferase subunit B